MRNSGYSCARQPDKGNQATRSSLLQIFHFRKKGHRWRLLWGLFTQSIRWNIAEGKMRGFEFSSPQVLREIIWGKCHFCEIIYRISYYLNLEWNHPQVKVKVHISIKDVQRVKTFPISTKLSMDSLQSKRPRCDGGSRGKRKVGSNKYWWVGHSHGPRVRGRKRCRSVAIPTKIVQNSKLEKIVHFVGLLASHPCNTFQRGRFQKLASGKLLKSPLWFPSPFASHKRGKKSWMASAPKICSIQGCISDAKNKDLWSAIACTGG